MLIVLPPSETKRDAPERGAPVALHALSFPTLRPMRERMVDALIDASRQPDALERLSVTPSLGAQVVRNTALRELPARAASQVYTGALHSGLDYDTLSPAARHRAELRLVIASSLWGLLRPNDRIPPYRLLVWATLNGIGRVDHAWRAAVPAVLTEAAGAVGPVVDLRSPPYQSIGKPVGRADRTVTVRVLPRTGERTIGDVIAKRVRGQLARHLLECAADPVYPDELADNVATRWPVRLEPPNSPRGSWTLVLRPDDY